MSMSAGEMPRLRLSVLGVVVISLFAALFSRLWYLQVMDSNTFKVAAQKNQFRVVYEAALEGASSIATAHVLVDNRFRFVVSLPRQSVAQHPEVDRRASPRCSTCRSPTSTSA